MRTRLPSLEDAVRGIWPLLSLAVILVVLAALCSLGPVVLQRVATDALIKLVMVVGLTSSSAIPACSPSAMPPS